MSGRTMWRWQSMSGTWRYTRSCTGCEKRDVYKRQLMDRVLAFFRWLGEAPVNLCICLVGVAIVFAVFDWLLTRKAPITCLLYTSRCV